MQSKFKRWLIRKLGGYTAPCIRCKEYANLLVQVTRPVETFKVAYDMNNCGCTHIDEFARGYIVSEFVQQLNDRNFIKWEKRDGVLYASLKVVRQP